LSDNLIINNIILHTVALKIGNYVLLMVISHGTD